MTTMPTTLIRPYGGDQMPATSADTDAPHRGPTSVTRDRVAHDTAFRNAFNAIARHALPHMAPDAYHSDLLYDAAYAAEMPVGGRFYLLVRFLGTNMFQYGDDAAAHCRPHMSDGRAVLRVVRGRYDCFTVHVTYTRPE
jgi:hypothetical protein